MERKPSSTGVWKTFNVSSLVAVAGFVIIVFGLQSSYTSRQERQDARIDALEITSERQLAQDERLADIASEMGEKLKEISTILYRISQLENNAISTTESLENLKERSGDIRTAIEVLTEQIRREFKEDRETSAGRRGPL